MRKPSEMHVALRMQNMAHIRAQNAYFATKLHFGSFATILLGLSALRAPAVEPLASYAAAPSGIFTTAWTLAQGSRNMMPLIAT